MPQKRARPLYLAKLLQERTDEDHTLTVSEIIEYLARQGISAERKAVYDDLELLRTIGMDIVHTKTKTHNYYLGQRTFQLAEVKLLIDVVQSSPFLTAKKSMELIGKLETLASAHQAAGLNRQVFVLSRLKTPNEQLYYLIDAMDRAIQTGRVIRFRYFDWSVQGRRIYRRSGAWYEESPVALCVDRNYYLITYRPDQGKYIHFRVDRMDALEVTDRPRAQLPPHFDLASYVRTIFDMHSGSSQRVLLELKDKLAEGQSISDAGENISGPAVTVIPQNKLSEASAALAVLGYSQGEINTALKGIDIDAQPLEQIIRLALKNMVKP